MEGNTKENRKKNRSKHQFRSDVFYNTAETAETDFGLVFKTQNLDDTGQTELQHLRGSHHIIITMIFGIQNDRQFLTWILWMKSSVDQRWQN